jgi:hypothetical protein
MHPGTGELADLKILLDTKAHPGKLELSFSSVWSR